MSGRGSDRNEDRGKADKGDDTDDDDDSRGEDGQRDGGTGRRDGSSSPQKDGSFAECADTRVDAETKPGGVNVVWVIDTSGSMNQEAAAVQDNMNRFVQVIGEAGLSDYRVVVVSKKSFINVPDPLGSDAVRFRHVEESVNSDEPLSDLLKRYGDYADFLLPNTITHFIAVTDDESNIAGGQFVEQMRANIDDIRVHAIASPPGEVPVPGIPLGGCIGSFGNASREGIRYWEAAMLTGGLTFSICSEDWSGLFDELAKVVGESAAVPCSLALPESPQGQALDYTRINVVYTDGAGDDESLKRVADADACGNAKGWHYDDAANPTGIVLCKTSCELAEAGGSLNISLGCTTIVQ